MKQETSLTAQSQKMQELLTDFLVCQDDLLVEMFLRKIAQTSRVSFETVVRTFSQIKKKQKTAPARTQSQEIKPVAAPTLGAEDTLLMFLFASPAMTEHIPAEFQMHNPVKQDLLTRLRTGPCDETVQ